MAERYVFPVRFDAAQMRAAVNAFTLRSLFVENRWRTFAPLIMIGISCIALAYMGESSDAELIFVAALGLLAVFISGGWRMQQRMMRTKVERLKGHISRALLSDEGVVVDTGGDAPLLPWKQVKAIWPGEKVWLLMTATNHYIALPIESAPKEALVFMQARVDANAAAKIA